MAGILQVDAASYGGEPGDRYGTLTVAMPGSGSLWTQMMVKVAQNYLDDFSQIQSFSAEFARLGDESGIRESIALYTPDGGVTWTWMSGIERPDTPIASGDTWYTLENHYNIDAATTEWLIDGVSLGVDPISSIDFASPFFFGALNGPGTFSATGEYIWIKDIRIGTSQGGTEKASADFSTGDLSQFASVVHDTYNGPSSVVTRMSVISDSSGGTGAHVHGFF